MKGRLLNLLTLLSLLLCVAVVALWVRSHRFQDTLQIRPREGGGLVVHLFWARGSIACTRTYGQVNGVMPPEQRVRFEADLGRFPRFPPVDLYALWKTRDPVFHRAGFAVMHASPKYGALGGVLVPLWSFAALFALPPTVWLSLKLRSLVRCRRHVGSCLSCGYDLRATPDRCPECGTFAEASSAR
jgi:hypothetical protein